METGRSGMLRSKVCPTTESPEVDHMKPLRMTAAAFAALLGLLTLVGWVLDLDWLTRLAPGMTATNPMTAVAFTLAALALALGPRRRPMPARLLAGLVLGIGGAKLAMLLTGLPFAVDRLMFADQLGRTGDIEGSLMPTASAFVLMLFGGALLLSGSRGRRAGLAAQILCGIVFAITLFVVVGYGLDIVGLNGVIRIKMSFYSAVGFMALAAGTASIGFETGVARIMLDRGAAGSMARAALPFALLASMLVGTEDGTMVKVFTNLLVTLVLLAGCIVALLRTDRLRRHRESAMEQSDLLYRHAEQVGHIGHWLVEYPSGAVTWSEEYYKICGLPKDTEPNIETALALYHPDDAVAAREIAQAVKDGRGWEIGLRIRRPGGEVRYIKSHGVCEHSPNGDVTAIFGVFADVTELEFAQREAEAATASKAAFLANMSHEIRTPMNGVMGFVELLMDSKLDAKQRRHLVLVQESAQALLKLLNDILDLSKIDAGQLDLSAEPSNVRHDITQCVRLMTPAAEQKGLEFKVIFAEGFPDNVLIDSLRFRQVLFNLLGNAVKFTSRGSVSVTLDEASGPAGKRLILVSVADTGVGIAEERKAAIFDAFVQADASVSRRFGGSGLGLSISRSLAGLMGGTIALESEENKGTRVTLTLPLDEVFAPALTAVGRSGAAMAIAEAKPLRRQATILLVEDIDINRELITEMLNRLGHRVDVAVNGADALSLAHRLARDPGAWDMILMDVQMPIMDGLTATRAIRALGGRAATIPIVALTANAFATEMQACRDAGMDDHIAKPSGFAQLKQAVELWGDVVQSPAPPTGFGALETVSVADRFETRLRKSTERLTELTGEFSEAEGEAAAQLLREAAGIAHVLAGTAGMFGRASLGKVALQVEGEIKALATGNSGIAGDKAKATIGKLVDALRATGQPASAAPPARAA
jgi:signal transduction histidine kinase/CheY-like chemotaxis protein/HPt (histidine-containing phosphotransfer) domain-containing protein